jgi:hypothetical protein
MEFDFYMNNHWTPLIGGSYSLFFLPISSNYLIVLDKRTPLDSNWFLDKICAVMGIW